ncbi:SapC family protein [Pseudohongiella nitratireducens]|jgi:hypothetical protein|uniref:SapC family protein n=1 Tax=Pseudohongiella nitratireducens TaxID=1768907 RepID=UPI0030ED4802|tara:strand:+ start:3856 stop:4692 length:837 start_codon:yes stop_codon:yes gene_type:complete
MKDLHTEQNSEALETKNTLLPISVEGMKNSFWQKPVNYHFAAKDILTELSINEISIASVNCPITFVQDKNKIFHLAMIQGFEQDKNLLVSHEGKWLSHFLPSSYRFYPFVLLKNQQENLMLYFNNAYSHLTGDPNSEPFYDDNEQPAKLVKQVFGALVERWKGVTQALSLTKQLEEAGLIVPWEMTLKRNDNSVPVKGYFRIDEVKLSKISPEELVKLRDTGALTLAYCQMLSMNKLHILQKLDELQQAYQNSSSSQQSNSNSIFNHNDDANLNFDNL